MCYHGKFLLCIPVEKASMVCAIIISILTGLSLLLSIIGGALNASNIMYLHGAGAVTAFFFVLAVASIAGMVFAVLLCYGISKRRAEYVKAYFIYGVVVTVLAVLVAVILLLVGFTSTLSLMIILSCVIYSLFLVLVQQTYFSILEGGNTGSVWKPNQLVET